MNKTERNFAERLVLLVQRHEAIYSPSHPEHKDRIKIDAIWVLIAATLNSTVETVKRKWQNLRGSYSKALASYKKIPSGSASTKPVRFYLFEQMAFLQPHMVHAAMYGNYGIVEDADTYESSQVLGMSDMIGRTELPDLSPGISLQDSEALPLEESAAVLADEASQEDPTLLPPVSSATPRRAKKRAREEPRARWEIAAEEFLEKKSRRAEVDPNPDNMFFQGLLPMVGSLSESSKLKFFLEVTSLLIKFKELDASNQGGKETAV